MTFAYLVTASSNAKDVVRRHTLGHLFIWWQLQAMLRMLSAAHTGAFVYLVTASSNAKDAVLGTHWGICLSGGRFKHTTLAVANQISSYMFRLRHDDGCSLQPKHVAVIIKAVCRRTTSLFLRVPQWKRGSGSLIQILTWRLIRDLYWVLGSWGSVTVDFYIRGSVHRNCMLMTSNKMQQ